MSYRIEIGESLAAAFGRIAAEEIDLARAELRRPITARRCITPAKPSNACAPCCARCG